MSMIVDAGIATLKFVGSLISRTLRNQKADSLVRFTKSTRVEPIAMIDQRLVHLPYLTDALQALTSIFTGYYLQAVALACNVGNVNVLRLLDTLNPTRDVADAAATKIADAVKGGINMLSFEAYDYGLPVPGQQLSLEAASDYHPRNVKPKETPTRVRDVSGGVGANIPDRAQREDVKRQWRELVDQIEKMEADPSEANIDEYERRRERLVATGGDYIRATLPKEILDGKIPGSDIAKINPDGDMSAQFGKDTIKSVTEATNLSVGKLVEVTIESQGSKATFPIMVRLIATLMGSGTMVHILGDGSRDVSYKERYHAWRAGQLEFWRDLVLCQDLIDEHKKVLSKDDTGVYDEILLRRQGNRMASTISSTPSIGTASNLVVLSAQTAKELEASVGGRLRDPKVRDKIFTSTYIMIMLIIDVESEMITFYHRGINLPTQLTVKELKIASKGDGMNIGDILKAYQLGMNPTI